MKWINKGACPHGYNPSDCATCVDARNSAAEYAARQRKASKPEQVAQDREELALFEHTDEQFGDCNETDTPAAMLMKWANKGWLECTHYEVTKLGRDVLEEYRAARASRQEGEKQ